jgi:uncharacterized protein YndB with AHSA1/START domain
MRSAIDIRDDGPMIVATVVLPECAPERALAAFTDPAELAQWWRGELTASFIPGGEYTVAFPAIPARLAGRVVGYEAGRALEFSWAWADDDGPPSTVMITAQPGPEPSSVLLTLAHGPHSPDAAGQAAHKEHWDGWEYFLPRLVAVLAAER